MYRFFKSNSADIFALEQTRSLYSITVSQNSMSVALLSKSDTQVLPSICDSGVIFAYRHKVKQLNDTNIISMVKLKYKQTCKDRVWSKYKRLKLKHALYFSLSYLPLTSSIQTLNKLIITHYTIIVGRYNDMSDVY